MGLFDGKVAIVTGAGRGVGRAEAMILASEGASVVVNDLGGSVDGGGKSANVADEVVAEIKASGGNAAANYSDISELDGVDMLIWTAMSKFGKLAAARLMKTQGEGGAIVNTTSISGLAGNFGQSNYGAAKLAIYGLTKINAMEFAKAGIRVNCVGPSGYTRMISSIPGVEMTEKQAEEYSSVLPTANLAVFLASDLAKDLTGRVMSSHGGSKINKISEYKMMNSEGFQKDDGMFSLQEIADNIDKMLFSEPDITMRAGTPDRKDQE